MVPGLSEVDCRIAALRYTEMVAEGQRQRTAASVQSPRAIDIRVAARVGARIGAFLVRVGQRLQHACASETQGIGSSPANERAAA
jgi:hypothetical protein